MAKKRLMVMTLVIGLLPAVVTAGIAVATGVAG